MAEEYLGKMDQLITALNTLEEEIAIQAEAIKLLYSEASKKMYDGKNYYLSGIHLGSVVRPYLLTSRGVEVHGEDAISVQDFIDGALKFANYPKRKIEVLRDLVMHLQKIREDSASAAATG